MHGPDENPMGERVEVDWKGMCIYWHDTCQEAWRQRDRCIALSKVREEEADRVRAERDRYREAILEASDLVDAKKMSHANALAHVRAAVGLKSEDDLVARRARAGREDE